MAKPKFKFVLDDVRNLVIEECANAIPTNWCDPLLTGPNKVGELPARETEALLRGIQDRIRGLKSAQ